MKSKELKEVIKRLAEVEEFLEECKALYREKDELIDKLRKNEVNSAEADGIRITVVDNFESKNTNFKVAAFARFSVKIDKVSGDIKKTSKKSA